MAYDEHLTDRIRTSLTRKSIQFEEKKMFGGIAFMVDDKMCVGVNKEQLMVRIDPETYDEALTREGAEPMKFTGREMKGFVFVQPEGFDMDADLEHWLDLALEFNPRAKASGKKKMKK